jgi:hypothetical protein
MLVDASVARSFAVIGWTRHLLQLGGGSILVADGVHGQHPGDPSELRSIRNALQRRADQADPGSGLASRALAAVHSIDQLLALAPNELTVVTLSQDEFEICSPAPVTPTGGPGVAALARRPVTAARHWRVGIHRHRGPQIAGLRQRRRRRPHPVERADQIRRAPYP